MTRIITRYFEDIALARRAVRELRFARFPHWAVKLYDTQSGLAAALVADAVDATTAAAYEARLAGGGAVLLVKAGYKPLAAAKKTRDLFARLGVAELGTGPEEVFVKDTPRRRRDIMDDHPLFFTRPRDPNTTTFHMANWPIPLISRSKPYRGMLIPPHGRMAGFPIPLLSRRKPWDRFAFPRHARMADMVLPLTNRRKPYDAFAFPRHARMADMVLPLTNRRKPYTKSIIARHARMANWPFPHLINGKTGTNALIPGGPRMANFPIPLISKRKPADKFAFPRHARMADKILPLTIRRKPYDASAFPRHARMADKIWPLIVRRSDGGGEPGKPTSFSEFFGLATLKRR